MMAMADNHTMEEMLQPPTEGYGDAIVVPDILAENFKIRTGLLSLIQENQFHGFESNNPRDHIRSFNKITSNLKFRDVPNGKTPQDALIIIENKSKVRFSRNKLVAFKVSTTSSGNSSSTDARIDKLSDTISNFVESFNKKMTTPTTVKAIEETCVICGGAHQYYDCIATDRNILSVCATTVTYNQGSTGFRPQVATNDHASPPGFPPVQNNQNRYNQNQNQSYNQNRGNNYQAPIQPRQVELKNEFLKYKQITETSIRAMQNHIDNFKTGMKNEIHSSIQNEINSVKIKLRSDNSNQTNELRNMMASYFQMNNASSSGSVSPPPSKEVDREPETITDQVLNRSTNNVPPLVVQMPPASTSFSTICSSKMPEVTKDTIQPSSKNIQPQVAQTQVPIDESIVASKPKSTIPYPSRANKQKLREKDDIIALNFVEILRNLHFELSFTDALLHMPKFALMFKNLLNNKENLFDLVTTLVNENCSTVILKKLHEKLIDPGKFLIPCDFPEFDECLALADLGASINLMPLSIWKKLYLPDLASTQMILKLADRSTTRPAGIAEDVFVKVGKFHFPTNFVVVDYVVDPRIPLVLRRPFLRIERALIDVYGEELTLRVDDEAITFNVGQNSKYFYNDSESINRIDVIGEAYEDDFIVEEIETLLQTLNELSNVDDDYYDKDGDILYLEKLLNEDPSPNLPLVKTEDLKQVEATMTKPSIEEPP
nr:hypothetical protein [Tanacetum cinerariifolium]